MRLYGESGRRGAAVQLYRTLADALRTELDAQPEAETRAVFAEITRGGEEPNQVRRRDATMRDAPERWRAQTDRRRPPTCHWPSGCVHLWPSWPPC